MFAPHPSSIIPSSPLLPHGILHHPSIIQQQSIHPSIHLHFETHPGWMHLPHCPCILEIISPWTWEPRNGEAVKFQTVWPFDAFGRWPPPQVLMFDVRHLALFCRFFFHEVHWLLRGIWHRKQVVLRFQQLKSMDAWKFLGRLSSVSQKIPCCR